MALLVEIHVPLPSPEELSEDEHPADWIEEVEDFLGASQVALLDGVPAGAHAMVTDDAAEEFGMGRRVNLPTP